MAFIFTKYNNWFEQTANDPTRRRVAIADLTRRRAILVGCAVVITSAAIAMLFTARSKNTAIWESLAAFLSWTSVFSVSSDLRLLKFLERFYGRDEKPAL